MPNPEFAAALAEAFAHLDALDPARNRFGAWHHGYRRGTAVEPAQWRNCEQRWGRVPATLRSYYDAMGDGGIGPGLGLAPLDKIAAFEVEFEAGHHQRMLLLAELGCGQVLWCSLAAQNDGALWVDTRACSDDLRPYAEDVWQAVLSWTQDCLHGKPPRSFVAPGKCRFLQALSQHLHATESAAGLAPGSLDGPALAAAVATFAADIRVVTGLVAAGHAGEDVDVGTGAASAGAGDAGTETTGTTASPGAATAPGATAAAATTGTGLSAAAWPRARPPSLYPTETLLPLCLSCEQAWQQLAAGRPRPQARYLDA